ncbi:MAG: phosphomethylpyrimidine synthase ThiC [Candidatus Methanospirareceae archaeon]
MTILEKAINGEIPNIMSRVAQDEKMCPEVLRQKIANGHAIILKSDINNCIPVGIGGGMRIKVNANIGTSPLNEDIDMELEKLKLVERYGADTVMDLSIGGNISKIRARIIEHASIPVGTVPIYEAITTTPKVAKLDVDDILDAVRSHIEDGVDFITVHCGLTAECIELLRSRTMGVVSRGGSILVKWMTYHNEENPLYTYFNKVVSMAKKHDVVLSLGDGLRPGCLADATDAAQMTELNILGELAVKAKKSGVQVMIEGPGHIPLNQIKENVEIQKKCCHGAPFYVLGPLVTDISPGYDHITGAIGGALAAFYGADFLCYLTPKEHLGLPNRQDVIDGVIASRIAAHAADIARGFPGAQDVDDEMSRARSCLDWEAMYKLSLDSKKARAYRSENLSSLDTCSMCGDFCSVKMNKEWREEKGEDI